MREKKKRRGYWRGVRERKGGEDRAGELEGKRGEGRGGEEKDENLKVYVTSLLSLISVVLAKLFDNFGLILSSKQIQPALLFFFFLLKNGGSIQEVSLPFSLYYQRLLVHKLRVDKHRNL